MADNRTVFPFQFISFPCEAGSTKPFIEQVKKVLLTDIQKENSFGCKIQNCHTHAGSKIHFKHFIEAELLFHNSYYNKSFAWLSYDWLEKYLQEYNLSGISNILLIGYEKYSELYLQDFCDIIKANGKECFYCVYETVAETCKDGSRKNSVMIRNLQVKNSSFIANSQKTDQESSNDCFAIDDTLCLFIVPINTSLSTMDKMISKFSQVVGDNSFSVCKIAHLCLITLFPIEDQLEDENGSVYWDFDKKENDTEKDELPLIPKNDKFEFLNNKIKVHNIVAVGTNWFTAKCCDICYPSVLTDEEPVFGVNRGSVVPMLRIGTIKAMNPISKEEKNKALENLKRVSELSEFLSYQHILRGENHYQYYLNTELLILKKQSEIEKYLTNISVAEKKTTGDIQIFDYIIAPRHESNAKWVHMIHKIVFNESARIIYFDVEKEYRSNLKAKYSDIICGLENIEKSRQDYEIRFHFVDDTIQSGATFLRAKSLISSLVPQNEHVKVFYSAYILINRISKDTQDFYMGNHKRFHCYTDVNISPMRSFEDACTLCKLIADYYNIRSQCATNRLANICSNGIKRHLLASYPKMLITKETTADINDISKAEKQLVFFITHLLNERLANRLYLENIEKKDGPIDIEKTDEDIICILNDYYHNNIKEYSSFEWIEETVWKLAFIKAISRPFFINHIRQRQASFSFCLTQLDELLNKNVNEISVRESALIQTLVKALTDMNANYLFREKILEKLLYVAELSSSIIEKCNGDSFYTKRLFSSESLIHYMKKDLVLSRDTTKSLLLERILLTGFEKEDDGNTTSCLDKFISDNCLTPRAYLYLENNVILKNGLSDSDSGNNLEKLSKMKVEEPIPYYLNNLKELWKLNAGDDSSLLDTIRYYNSLKENLLRGIKNKKIQVDLSHDIDLMFGAIGSGDLQSIAFVYDSTEKNPLFQFFTLAGKPADGSEELKNCKFKEIKTSQAFFYDNNLDKIRENIRKQADKDIFFIEDTLCSQQVPEKATYDIIIRFAEDIDLQEKNDNENEYAYTDSYDNSINVVYLQIWGFNKSNLTHWFALKLLLSLREDFVKLIHSINLQELIKERKVDAQKAALAIKKSTTHGKIDRYYELDFLLHKIRINPKDKKQKESAEKYYKYYVENHEHHHDAFPVLYDKYLQLLSDDFLPSIYKKIIRYEGCFNIVSLELEEYLDQLDHVFGGVFEEKNDKNAITEKVLPITIIDRELTIKDMQKNKKITLNVKLNIPQNKFSEYRVLRWSGSISPEMAPTVSFVLFAVNAVEHGNVERIDVEINEDGVTFLNEIKSFSIDANSYDNLVLKAFMLQNDIEKSYSIPPWVMNEPEQHLTLWTLFHAKGIYGTQNIDESFSPAVEIKPNKEKGVLEFRIKIKSIKKKGRTDDEYNYDF